MAKRSNKKKLPLDKRELEKEIAYLQGLNNSLLEQVPVSVLIVDRGFKVIFANRNFYLKTRKNPVEVIHKHIREVFPPAFFIGRSKFAAKVEEVIKGAVVQEDEIRWRGYIYNCKIFPLKNELERNQNAIILLDDVTQEKYLAEEVRKIERHLTNVVESANDLVFSADTRGRILTWNKAAQSILGYELDEMRGKTFASLCFKQDRPKIRMELNLQKKKKKKKDEKGSHYEMIFPTKDGGEVLISWSFGVIRDDQSRAIGLMGLGRDLTERRRLEAQLVQSAKMASLGTLSSGMAHELRNPMAIASGAAQLLLKREKEGFIKECSKRIYSGIKRASEIIENLLRFSHVSGTKTIPVDINSVLDETLSLVEYQISLEKIKIVKGYTPSLPQVLANKNRLQQVFMNLIINAIDAMRENKGELKLETKNGDNNSVKILVRDSGCGIVKENIPRIFDPFFTTKAQERNTGLGLFITYGIIKDHKGNVAVESESRKGTTFVVTLPTIESFQKEAAEGLKEATFSPIQREKSSKKRESRQGMS